MSLGRELFGFLLRSDLNVAKIAEGAGITMDTLKDAPPEALSAILDRAARSGAIDPREANNINIQLAKDAQEVAPEIMATYKGRSVTLNKPRRIAKGETSYGKKKSVVYVMDGDKAKRVTFGDPDMTIKKTQKGRRANFRARHNCDDAGPKTKARYWSCKAW
jgi:hypothetical protein